MLAVIGSLGRKSSTRAVMHEAADLLRARGCEVDILDFVKEPLELFDPETSYEAPVVLDLRERVDRADVLLLGTPDYHGSVSSAMKSFLDHFWHEFAGKLFGIVVLSHEKGLTVMDQLRTVARQCYAWTLPYGVSVAEKEDLADGKLVGERVRQRLEMMARDLDVYGRLLADQRRADLGGSDIGFMARYRK